MKIRSTFWGVLIVLVIGIVGVFWTRTQGLSEDQVRIFYQLIYLCTLLIILSAIWTFFSVRGITIMRSARGLHQQLGQIFEERFELFNTSRISHPYLEVRDEAVLFRKGGSRVISWIAPHEKRNYNSYTYLSKRGEFSLGPTVLFSGDPFGLFSYTRRLPAEKSLLVLPHTVDLEYFPFPPGLLPGGRALHRKTSEPTPHAAGVREYVPGDPRNRIHWPSTARRNRMMVKEFDQDPQADVWIFLDSQKKIQVEQNTLLDIPEIDQLWLIKHNLEVALPADTYEYAVSIAASVSKYFIEAGQSVGMASAGQGVTVLPAERGDRQLGKILENLAFLRGDGKLPLHGIIQAQVPHLPRGSIVVIITCSTEETVEVAIDELNLRSLRPIIVLIDPSSFGGDSNSEFLASRFEQKQIPYVLVSKGDNLKEVLEHGFIGSPFTL
ncbi:MAG: DUF58 domain-containing protein [Anaerolineaceae bacterium]|nr:DUF58 domain-containing protein [Anaerolineaceae bacterium]